MDIKPKFFPDQSLFRDWLRKHHKQKTELWVGYYKKGSGLSSMTWSESVDQALCYGWIDGLRKSIDDVSYMIRFTPRRPTSNWSDVNIKKIEVLRKNRLMRKAGEEAYSRRKKNKSGVYGYEKPATELRSEYKTEFKTHKTAWKYYQNCAPGYKKLTAGWIMSAKKEETQRRRLTKLIKHSALGERVP
jgi:uncharacterized protein YdeI (YjbR/CyaY-like superfamily)